MSDLLPYEEDWLAELEAVVDAGLHTFVEVGRALGTIRDERLYRATHDSFGAYRRQRWGVDRTHAYRLLDAGRVVDAVSPMGDTDPPASERVARELVPLLKRPDDLRDAWREIHTISASAGIAPTTDLVRQSIKTWRRPRPAPGDEDAAAIGLKRWGDADASQRIRWLTYSGMRKFNPVNDNIGWARWSWNPVTGCLHNCDYCYARDLAERFYAWGFTPALVPEAIIAPQNTKIPKKADDDPAWRRVFTCSMADLFGKWVPQEWIDAVFEQIVAAPQWEFLCLTKFPQRLATLDWPDNVWAGTTVDRQHRVDLAQRHFAEVKAGVKWLSCEPLLEPLRFDSLEMFDWVVIGASTGSRNAPPVAPDFDWVVDLYEQARAAGCRVYLKSNLVGAGASPGIRPIHEWPWSRTA